jgi:hypothetical protein
MRTLVSCGAGLAALLLATAAGPALAAPAPTTGINLPWSQLPDWSGLWQMRGPTVFDGSTVEPKGGRAGEAGTRERPPYNAAWEKKYLENIRKVADNTWPDPNSTCGTPAGFPRLFNMPDAYEFVVRPEQTWLIAENGPNVMRIYTDGRGHPGPNDIWNTYGGDSIGHWEGDTLVIDTIAVKGDGFHIIDRTGLVTSDQLHGVTRLRMVSPGVLQAELTLTDPVAFTRPWVVTKTFDRLKQKDVRAFDYSCSENNRNPIDADGFTLTLGSDGKPIDARAKK